MRAWWVAALAVLGGCGRPAATPGLRDVAREVGIAFTHEPGARGEFLMPEIMGSGCALFDMDSDGDPDALLLQGVETAPHRLFRNDGGRFTDVTEGSGLRSRGRGMGVAVGDFDNDGRPDLLITAYGDNALYRNLGGGRFEETGQKIPGPWSTSAAFFDYDRDGWLDLAVLNYVDFTEASNRRCLAPTGEPDYCTPRVYKPLPARLFHNERGQLREVPGAFGKALGPGLGAAVMDANADGWPDLMVANDSMANHLWINQKDGTFRERALESGVAYGEEGLAKAGMGVAPGDFDNDGDEDVVVLNLMNEGATLFRNNQRSSGGSDFTDASRASGIHTAAFRFTGFGVGWLDMDGDGWLDLFMANGAVTRREEQRGQPYPFLERNLLLKNTAGKFSTLAELPEMGVSRGAAFGDIDNDGDVDVLVNVNRGQARLLRNELNPRRWLAVEAKDGDRVVVASEGLPEQVRVSRASGSYLSSNSTRTHFALRGRVTSVTVNGRPVQAANGIVILKR